MENFFTEEKVQKILKNSKDFSEWYVLLSKYLKLYKITSINGVAAFLANVLHESGDLTRLEENLNYSAERLLVVFPKYFNKVNVVKYAGNKIAIASRIYGNRMGNGDEASKEGYKFRGRGILQITGKNNYTELSHTLEKTLDETVEYLSTKEGALVGSLIYWNKNKINEIADKGDIVRTRKLVNGGTIGLDDVIARYNKIISILKS